MRTSKTLTASALPIVLSLGVGLLILSCDIKNPTDDLNLILNVEVEKPIFSGEISAEPTTIPIVSQGTIGGPGVTGGYLAKAMVNDFIEVPISIPNMHTFLAILKDETAAGGNFVGSLTNRATNPVTFGVYFSSTPGLIDPWNDAEAIFIASLTLTAAPSATEPSATVIIDGPEDFDTPASAVEVRGNMTSYVEMAVQSAPEDPIIVYLTSKTPEVDPNEEIDVLIENMSLKLPAEVEVWNTITPGDLENYRNKIEEIIDAQMNGTITNNGSVDILFYAYLHLATETLDPVEHLIAKTKIAANSTLVFADSPQMFVPGDPDAVPPKLSGEQKLRNGVALLQAGNTLKAYLHFFSRDLSTPISATVNDIELESNVQVIE